MNNLIQKNYPSHSIIGEEENFKKSNTYEWCIDPIDGTKSFIQGMPLWGTLISLSENGNTIIGLADIPVLNERYLGYGKKAYELLLGYILDPEYGDITDSLEGTDITLVYTKPTTPGAYPQTSLKMRRSTSTLLEDQEAIPALLDRMPDFDSLFERLSPEEIDTILDEQLSGNLSAEQRSSETSRYNNADSQNPVDKAFDELMANK